MFFDCLDCLQNFQLVRLLTNLEKYYNKIYKSIIVLVLLFKRQLLYGLGHFASFRILQAFGFYNNTTSVAFFNVSAWSVPSE